jgi:hypothetical protein
MELYAAVRIELADETLILYARNISLGGVALEAELRELEQLPVGTTHEVLLFDAANEEIKPLALVGVVVRHDLTGFAMMWTNTDAETAFALASLLSRLKPRGARERTPRAAREDPAAEPGAERAKDTAGEPEDIRR